MLPVSPEIKLHKYVPLNVSNNDMSKKVLLITFIILLFVTLLFLSIVSLIQNHHQVDTVSVPPTPISTEPSPTSSTSTVFASLSMQRTATGITVMVDTDNKDITAAQIKLSYDPTVLTNVQVSQGNFFSKPFVLSNKIDKVNGEIFYAVAITPSSVPQRGKGIIVNITFDVVPGVKSSTTLHFLPATKITSIGIDQSVIQKATDLTFPLQ